MERRNFMLTSGCTVLFGLGEGKLARPAVGLDFEVSEPSRQDPSKVDSIVIAFKKLELTPQYVDESETMTVQAKLEVAGKTEETEIQVPVRNGETKNLSDDIGSLVVDEIPTSNSLSGDITVSLDHPSVQDSYSRNFYVSDPDIPDSTIFDGWDDGKLINRDNFNTTPYEYQSLVGVTNNTRPEWDFDNNDDGTVSGSELVIDFDSAADPDGIISTGKPQGFDNSGTYRIFVEMATRVSSNEEIYLSLCEDRKNRLGTDLRYEVAAGDNELTLSAADNTKTVISQSMSSGSYYSHLIDVKSNSIAVYFEPSDPTNPQSSEQIGSISTSSRVDTSLTDAGIKFWTSHGGSSGNIRRLELFQT